MPSAQIAVSLELESYFERTSLAIWSNKLGHSPTGRRPQNENGHSRVLS